jgi:1,4-dihydroxy-6-naphthoate synthase
MTRKLRVGLSPCPNDTFIFHALFNGLVELPGIDLEPVLEDVETLNQMARTGDLEVTKISFHAYGHLRHLYTLLDAGSALGRGCGPLVVVRPEDADIDVSKARVAIPGTWTSAALLLRLWTRATFDSGLDESHVVEMTFDRILESVQNGDVDAGLIIHESRFTYAGHGLTSRVDLGEWWEEAHDHPIPLGGIIARRDLGDETIAAFDRALGASVVYAQAHPDASRDYVRAHAQELSDDVTQAHIDLYVNESTVSLGVDGHAAVDHLLAIAEREGVIPLAPNPSPG